MKLKLVVSRGRTRTRTIPLRSAETVIGRRSGCNLRIASAEVSRRHCRLCSHDGVVTIEDLDSFNGTYLNGQRITSKRRVRPGDQIEVGPLTFTVEYHTPGTATELSTETEEMDLEPLALEEDADLELVESAADSALPTRRPAADPADSGVIMLELDESEAEDSRVEEADMGHLPGGDELRDILSHLEE